MNNVRKYFRITYYIGGILLFGIIAIIGYTQTRSFKTYLRDLLLHESLTAINGELQLGAIEGNLLTGFRINDVTVTELWHRAFFGSTDRIEIRSVWISF